MHFINGNAKMKNIFKPGDKKTYSKLVSESDTAKFETGTVHELYSTFALGRDAEWCTRLFVIDMKEYDEEGIGTFLEIQHLSAAPVGSEVNFTATIESISGNTVVCSFEAKVFSRLIATGRTGQKILKKVKLDQIINSL